MKVEYTLTPDMSVDLIETLKIDCFGKIEGILGSCLAEEQLMFMIKLHRFLDDNSKYEQMFIAHQKGD